MCMDFHALKPTDTQKKVTPYYVLRTCLDKLAHSKLVLEDGLGPGVLLSTDYTSILTALYALDGILGLFETGFLCPSKLSQCTLLPFSI